MTTNQAIEVLNKGILKGRVRTYAEFTGDPSEPGLWLQITEGTLLIGGLPAADYYIEDVYGFISGVHPEVVKALQQVGYYPEWYDAGTLMAFPE